MPGLMHSSAGFGITRLCGPCMTTQMNHGLKSVGSRPRELYSPTARPHRERTRACIMRRHTLESNCSRSTAVYIMTRLVGIGSGRKRIGRTALTSARRLTVSASKHHCTGSAYLSSKSFNPPLRVGTSVGTSARVPLVSTYLLMTLFFLARSTCRYLGGSYLDHNLSTIAGRDAELEAIDQRFKQGWFDSKLSSVIESN